MNCIISEFIDPSRSNERKGSSLKTSQLQNKKKFSGECCIVSFRYYREYYWIKEKKKLTDIGLDRLAFIRSLEIIYWTVTRTLDVLRLPIRINQLLLQM